MKQGLLHTLRFYEEFTLERLTAAEGAEPLTASLWQEHNFVIVAIVLFLRRSAAAGFALGFASA